MELDLSVLDRADRCPRRGDVSPERPLDHHHAGQYWATVRLRAHPAGIKTVDVKIPTHLDTRVLGQFRQLLRKGVSRHLRGRHRITTGVQTQNLSGRIQVQQRSADIAA